MLANSCRHTQRTWYTPLQAPCFLLQSRWAPMSPAFWLIGPCSSCFFHPHLTPIIFPPSLQLGSQNSKGWDPMETSNWDSFSTYGLTLGPCTCSHLMPEEASVMTSGKDTNLWGYQNIIRSHAIFFTCHIWFYPYVFGHPDSEAWVSSCSVGLKLKQILFGHLNKYSTSCMQERL